MKILLVLSLLFFASFSASSQQSKTSSMDLTGYVKDSATGLAIDRSTIHLKNTGSRSADLVINSDSVGHFVFTGITKGNYTLTISHVGYQLFSKNYVLNKDTGNNLQIGTIRMKATAGVLQNITVTATKNIIENKIDRLVYHVDNDLTSQGGMATDILKKIPQVTVDINGNVELLGNPSVKFLINGKPSAIFGNSVTDALQSIPTSQIQSIEVMTNPGAKYDAAGTGGIINIILKKSKAEGYNGNISLSAGTRLENAAINASIKKNNMGVNGYFSGNKQMNSRTPVTMSRHSVNSGTGSSGFFQQSNADFKRDGYRSGIALDWNLSKKDNVTASVGYNHFANQTTGDYDQSSVQYDAAGNEISHINSIRAANNKSYVNEIEPEVSYIRKFKKENQELEIFYTGSYAGNNTFYDQSQRYQNTDTLFAGASSLNPGKENETEFGVNYGYPVKKDMLLETGFKTGIESIISNADVLILNMTTKKYVTDSQQSFQSDFRRTVYAGYLSLSFSLKKIADIKTGLRFEHTNNNATYSNVAKAAIPSYNNLAPSLVILHEFKNKQTLKFAFSYRLERPDFRDLNPFMNLSDPHNISTGNPNLQPEIGHNYELSYSKTFENGAIMNLTFNVQKNSPDIKSYSRYYATYKIGDSVYTDVTLTSRANIAVEVRPGINLFVSLPITKELNVRTNIQLFERHLKNVNATPAITNGFAARMNANIGYQFSKTLATEIFGNYNSGMKWQGRRPPSFSYTMAVRKQFRNNKGSIGFVAVNPFNKYINQKTLQETSTFTTTIFQQLPYRSFGISFTYRFGKLKFSKPKEGDNYLYTPPVEN